MKIPFLDSFRKISTRKKSSGSTSAKAASKPPRIVKAKSDRLSKTVTPNAMRTGSTQETSETDNSELAASASPPPSPRTISFSPGRKTTPRKDLPPAVAQALQPKVERAISLDLVDVVTEMPDGLVKPVASLDSSRRILLKASELEKRMAEGKPSVSLGTIYQQAPEIFLRSVTPSDATQIPLPFHKVLEAFKQMQGRHDQAVRQGQTPSLEPTSAGNERLDLPNERSQTAEIPAVRLEPPRTRPIASAQTQLAASEKAIATTPTHEVEREIPLRKELTENPTTGRAADRPKTAPERISFQLPPKETGEPASERVPASSGPPVSTVSIPPPGPARIPFTVVPPTTESFPKPLSVPPPELPKQTTSEQKKISFALKPILQSFPVFELSGDPNEVPAQARIEFPLSLIEPQLATGRVAVAPDVFEKALPPECQRFFSAKDLQMPILLPLQEVLKNVPAESLRMRDDQEERETDEEIETPFSTTAAEDAKRFKQTTAPSTKPFAVPAEEMTTSAASVDAKSVIVQASQLPGVRACAISFADGLSLAGNLPVEIGAEGLCAIAPALLQRFQTHLLETKLGDLNAITVHCANSTVTFFRHANICLAALHANGQLTLEVREQVSHMLENLSRIYSQTEASHVDH